MPKSRLSLQTLLEKLLDSRNVYYQPPESVKMEYPCIKYSVETIESKYANNKRYVNTKRYVLIVISKLPDNEVIDKLLDLELSSFDRHYVVDNLHHDVINLYY